MSNPNDPAPPSSELGGPARRINITILESQHAALVARGLSVSGTIRQLLADYLSNAVLTLPLDPETRKVHDMVRAAAHIEDAEIAQELRSVLERLLDKKLKQLEQLKRRLR